jgi:hypothetical protein
MVAVAGKIADRHLRIGNARLDQCASPKDWDWAWCWRP